MKSIFGIPEGQKNSQFDIFEVLKQGIEDFWQFLKSAKMAVLDLLKSSKLISRKVRVHTERIWGLTGNRAKLPLYSHI